MAKMNPIVVDSSIVDEGLRDYTRKIQFPEIRYVAGFKSLRGRSDLGVKLLSGRKVRGEEYSDVDFAFTFEIGRPTLTEEGWQKFYGGMGSRKAYAVVECPVHLTGGGSWGPPGSGLYSKPNGLLTVVSSTGMEETTFVLREEDARLLGERAFRAFACVLMTQEAETWEEEIIPSPGMPLFEGVFYKNSRGVTICYSAWEYSNHTSSNELVYYCSTLSPQGEVMGFKIHFKEDEVEALEPIPEFPDWVHPLLPGEWRNVEEFIDRAVQEGRPVIRGDLPIPEGPAIFEPEDEG